jgi:hypothetical protein
MKSPFPRKSILGTPEGEKRMKKEMRILFALLVLCLAVLALVACGDVQNAVQKKIDDVKSDINNDATPPTAPGLTSVTATASGIVLQWTASKDTVATSVGTVNDIPVSGYNIYRNGVQAQSDITDLNFTDNYGLTHGTQYCYTVTAFDHAKNESAKSQELCANAP